MAAGAIILAMEKEKGPYSVGQVAEGVITGIKPYGAFVRMGDGATGLIHISEISRGYVSDVRRFVRLGEKIVVKVIDIDPHNGQLRLSLKAIHPRRRPALGGRRPPQPGPIGFSTLAAALPGWITQAQKRRDNDDKTES